MADSAHPAKLAKDWEDFSTSWFRVGHGNHSRMNSRIPVFEFRDAVYETRRLRYRLSGEKLLTNDCLLQ